MIVTHVEVLIPMCWYLELGLWKVVRSRGWSRRMHLVSSRGKTRVFSPLCRGEHSNVVSGIPHHLRPQDRRPGVGLVG